VLNADKRPYSIAFAKLWVPKTKVLGGNLGLSLVSSDVFSWAHGEVTGLINFEDTVQGWGFGDTTARAQLGWNSGPLSNTLYLTTWFPTGRYQRGFSPNTGKNHYGVNLGWGFTYSERPTKLEFDSAVAVTFNAVNPATDYKDGRRLHLGLGRRQKIRQRAESRGRRLCLSAAHGRFRRSAKLGPFKGRVFAAGPHVVYDTIVMHHPVLSAIIRSSTRRIDLKGTSRRSRPL
jgi:hypothetical protein